MRAFNYLLLAVLVCASACGRQIVEFRDTAADAGIDGRTDAPIAVRPVVTSTMPSAGAMGVALNTLVTATFSKPMNAATLTAATFTLSQGSTVVTGPVTMNTAGTTATLTPTAPLQAGLVYTATVTTGATDTDGLSLAASFTWMFTAAPDALAPTVSSTMPASGATNVAITVSPTATFTKAMNPTTITETTFTLEQGVTPIAGTVTLNGATNTATFNPTFDLTAGLVYTATITTGAQDTGGLALATEYSWMFTAGTIAALPPMVSSTTPSAGAMNVAINTSPTATFDQTMDTATINTTTFTLTQAGTTVVGVVTLDGAGTTATFNPDVDLTAGLVYVATITTGAQASTGMALSTNVSWMFTATPPALPPTVSSTTPTGGATGVGTNISPTATFSQPMNLATINTTTFTLTQAGTTVVGLVTLDGAGTTATFNPTTDLTAGLVYVATITTGAQGTNGMSLATSFTWMFTTALPAPTVTSTTPASGATGVALNTSPTATFSMPMNPTTINTTTFTLTRAGTTVVGVVTLNGAGTTATFNPTNNLIAGQVYTATITTGAQGTNGVALATNYTWTFTALGGGAAPTVTSTTPLNGATNVALTVSPTATFSQTMNTATINTTTFTLTQAGMPIVGVVTLDGAGTTATFNPTLDLTAGLVYTATITTGAQGTNGMFLTTARVWTFTAAGMAPAPMVMMSTPPSGALNVSVNVNPTATFSQSMNATTINNLTFTLSQGITTITGMVTLNALTNTATFAPTVPLTAGLLYTATITTGAQSSTGVALAMDFTWTFTTGAACVVAPVALGVAADFAVLAGSTVTNTGLTVITGDVGVYAGTAITGFGPGIINGTQYAGIAPADTAQDNLTTAYNDAAGRTLCVVSVAGNLGGTTLPPGLYKSTSFLEVSSGDLVLDAQGDANAVWIFQMASGLTINTSRRVLIIGGGSAANVFWQVGTSAVLQTDSVMVGTIMADQSISFATRASLVGRALARIGAVTLDTTSIVSP